MPPSTGTAASPASVITTASEPASIGPGASAGASVAASPASPASAPASGIVGGTQAPPMHTRPAAHSLSTTQVVTQALPAQANGVQSVLVGVRHVPAPLHAGAAASSDAPTQASVPQATVAPGNVHAAALVPSQVAAQAPTPVQAARPLRGAPTTGVQVPWLPTMSHASHCCPQAESQQTPSVQNALTH